MRNCHERTPCYEGVGRGHGPDFCRGYGYGRYYGEAPGYRENYPFYPPHEYDIEVEREFLEHRLQNIHEQERYIKERLDKLESLNKKDKSKNSNTDN